MKKRIITSIFIIALTLSLPLSASQGLSVGDDFTFVVKAASGDFEYTDNAVTVSGETNKFRVGSTGVAKGQPLDVEVTNIQSTSVSFDIDNNGSNLASPTSTALGFGLSLILYSLYPFMVMGISTGSVNPIDPTKGVSLGDIWYIAPPSVDWNAVFDLYNDTANWDAIADVYGESEEEMTFTSIAQWYDNDETIKFKATAGGSYVIAADDTDLTIIHSVEFHYNVTNDVLQGYDVLTLITGTYEGSATTFSMNAEVAEESYTRRIGIEPLALILGVILSSGVLVVIRKRKK